LFSFFLLGSLVISFLFSFVELDHARAESSCYYGLVTETKSVGKCMTLTLTHCQELLKSVAM
jgi:hypothetical protein